MGVRKIGLSLGADICWPGSYREILQRLDLGIDWGGETVRFETDRVTIEPFDLQYEPKYDLVIDRLTHWFGISREWIKKIAIMDGVYVLNNPWAIQAMEKHTTYCAMMRLGFPIPKTWMIPAKEYDLTVNDMATTIKRYNRLFDLSKVGESVGYPAFFKPYDGGGWVGVKQVKNADELREAYDASGQRVNHLQAGVKDWDLFIRGIGIGPEVNVIRYDPSAPLHARYMVDFNYLDGAGWLKAQKMTRVINAFFKWDYNSCEMLRSGSTLHPIDFANACPDSQVTSLHFHFPWMVRTMVKWSLFCATTRRKPQLGMDWQPYLDIADDADLSFDEKLDQYDALAKAHFDSDRYTEFCARHLQDVDAVCHEFFGTDRFKELVREKVTALFPAHEIEQFTEHYFGLVQFWRKTETDRLGKGAS